mmetsp:Transcript_1679/g.5593  ORF Transcript_1679/g.5593 Transcript_1679/m.5593 type:complete len:84 (-) Transcript_1679:43-294(-)
MNRLVQSAGTRIFSAGRNSSQVRRYAADAHGEVKVNCWEKPTSIAEWKEEHIVIAVLAAWGVTITSAMKIFGGGDKEAAPEAT